MHNDLAQSLELQRRLSCMQALGHSSSITLGGSTAGHLGWRVGVNAGYIGQGMIMGPRVCISMLAGSIVGFAILAPIALARDWAHAASNGSSSAVSWVSWVSLSVMITDSLTSLAVLVIRYVVAATTKRNGAAARRVYQGVAVDGEDLHSAATHHEDAALVSGPGAILFCCGTA
jgi:uncharacterized oligopeptide transporter (OPT) family protein